MDELVLLDKSWLLASRDPELQALAEKYRLGFSHELFFEILTAPGEEGVWCLRKLRNVQGRVVVLSGVGALWRTELSSGQPIRRLEDHAVATSVIFNVPMKNGRLDLTPTQQAAIDKELSDRKQEGIPMSS